MPKRCEPWTGALTNVSDIIPLLEEKSSSPQARQQASASSGHCPKRAAKCIQVSCLLCTLQEKGHLDEVAVVLSEVSKLEINLD